MKTVKLNTVSAKVSSALNINKFAADVASVERVCVQAEKVAGCHGAARNNAVRKLTRIIASVSPEACYLAVVRAAQTKGLVKAILSAAHELDRPVNGKRREWGNTTMAALIKGIRAGTKFRNREVAERVFTGGFDGVWGDNAVRELAEWGEVDAMLERAVWHSTGFGRFRDVEPALCVVRTSADGLLNNSVDNEGEVSFTLGDDPELIAEYLAAAGLSPEAVAVAIEDLTIDGKVTIDIDHNVRGESGRIATGKAFDEASGDEADRWLRGQQVFETDILYHRPKDRAELFALLEDPQVHEYFMQRGAAVWADNLPALVKATSDHSALSGALYDQDTELPFKGRKAVRKVLTKLALWQMQAAKQVEVEVTNDSGSLTSGGKYRPGAVTQLMSVAEKSAHLFAEATGGAQVTKDIEGLENSYKFWNHQLPDMVDSYLDSAVKASWLLKESLLLSGLDIPLDSVAFDQVAAALVNLPSDMPAELVVKPVLLEGGVHLKDDAGRLLYWVTPFNECWKADGSMSDDGKLWAQFILDHRADTREIDNHVVGLGEAAAILDSLL